MFKNPYNWKDVGLSRPTKWRSRENGKVRVCEMRLHSIWRNMRKRCGLIRNRSFQRDRHAKYYQNVTMCDEWLYFPNFYHWAMENGYRDDLTIDRIDPDKGYCPENCRWATYWEQYHNRKDVRAREAAKQCVG